MDIKDPFISIIIPTYNVEKYLYKCLESISAQTYHHYEVIIIIDGATDKSYPISKDYCSKHENFSVFYQENAGSGPARNLGIVHATGELIMFVDPDDWLDTKLLEELVNAQKQGDYDITTSRKRSYRDNNGVITELPLSKYVDLHMTNQIEMIKKHKAVIEAGYCSAPTRTLYKTSIIKKYQIKFPSLRRSQDVAFNCLYYQYAQSFKSIEYVGYCYRIIPKTGIAKDRSKYYETFITLYKMFEDMYTAWGIEFDKVYFASHLFGKYFYSSLRLCVKQKVDIKSILKKEDVYNIIKFVHPSFNPAGFTSLLIKARLFTLTKHFLLLINCLKS